MYYTSPGSVISLVLIADSEDSSKASNLSIPVLYSLMDASAITTCQNIAALRQITTAYGTVSAAAGGEVHVSWKVITLLQLHCGI